MKPYTTTDNKGRSMGADDIHHRTADIPRAGAKKAAKVARHGARQEAHRFIRQETVDITRAFVF